MKKLKIGVVGVGRGTTMYRYCLGSDKTELVAVCDNRAAALLATKRRIGKAGIEYYTDYDEFLKHDMDVVMLANFATEHTPFAIKAMEAGKDVISEVLPAQTLSEAVRLIECVERTGRKYCYAENYCYMGGPREMKRRYEAGDLGEFEYGEGEYMHNCEPIWDDITYGDPTHWRNNMTTFYYCTHSAGPLIHITGKRPAKVTGFEIPFNKRTERMGAKSGSTGIEMVTFEDGTVFKSIHGLGCAKNSIWYTIYGSRGRMETAREDARNGDSGRIYVNLDKIEGKYGDDNVIFENYIPEDELSREAANAGHGGSDFYCLTNAINHILGLKADVVDVYEAINMWLVGFFAYQSVLAGGAPQEIPDFRKQEMRDLFRNDNRCTDPKVAKEMLLPSYSKGNPEIPAETYEKWRKIYEYNPQLLMNWSAEGAKMPEINIPENWKIVRFPELPNATDHWLEIVSHGLTSHKNGPEYYQSCMVNHACYKETDCFFVLVDGVPAATVAVICNDEIKDGYIHMVACKEDFRGLGIGNLMGDIAVKELLERGMKTAWLTTDDFRIPAIRSYLRSGFVPDESTRGFRERWGKIRDLL